MHRTTAISLCAVLLVAGTLWAQKTTGTISGEVQDASGAVLPAAVVRVINVETGVARALVSDERGRYRATDLMVGNYEIRAELAGFRAVVRTGVQLTIGREAIVNLILQVGDITQKIEVVGEAPLIETTTSSVSALVGEKAIKDLPLNGRSYDQLLTLNAGVVLYTSNTKGIPVGGTANSFSVSGVRFRSNRFTMDGLELSTSTANSTLPGGASGNNLGVEAIREFTVSTSTPSAEYGKKAGGQVNIVTKSGTNEIQGSAFYFHRNDNLDARNFFDRQKAEFRRNQYGGSLGGPIRRNKTFFFGNYEGLRESLGRTGLAIVPDANAHQGLLPDPANPATLIQHAVAPAVVPYLALYPLPNGRTFGDGTGEFIAVTTNVTRQDYVLGRVDHQLSDNSSLFGRYFIDDGIVNTSDVLGVTSGVTDIRNQQVVISGLHIFTPRLLNVLRVGYNRSGAEYYTDNLKGGSELGFVPGREMGAILFGTTTAQQQITFLGVSIEEFFYGNIFEASNQISYSRGSHSLKFGIDVDRIQRNGIHGSSWRGDYVFPDLRNFLAGTPNVFRGVPFGINPIKGWRQTYFAAYAQDDYQVMPRLTLNLGLRYESMPAPTEVNNRVSNFVTDLVGGYRIFRTDPKLGNPAFENSGPLFAPRVGFALDLTGSGKMSLRGGAGLYYDYIEGDFRQHLDALYPYYERYNLINPPFPHGLTAPVLTPNPVGFEEHADVPTVAQYNLSWQGQLAGDTVLRVGYVGSRGYHLTANSDINIQIPQILSDGRKFFPTPIRRRNPNLPSSQLIQTNATSRYNALQAELSKRFSGGLEFRVAYTFSRSIDDSPGITSNEAAAEAGSRLDPENIQLDKGLSSFDVRHNLRISYVYDLPGTNAFSGPIQYLLKGWQLGGIASISSGTPFSALVGFNRSQSGDRQIPDRPDLALGASNNPVLGGPERYFDATAFLLPEAGFWGNLGRNTLIGPGLASFDFSLVKNTAMPAISEQFGLQFRAEFFNLFNRANFGQPQINTFSASGARIGSAGRITSTTTTSRQIQLGLKLVF